MVCEDSSVPARPVGATIAMPVRCWESAAWRERERGGERGEGEGDEREGGEGGGRADRGEGDICVRSKKDNIRSAWEECVGVCGGYKALYRTFSPS